MKHKKLLFLSVPVVVIGGIVAVILLTGSVPEIADILSSKKILVDQTTLDTLPKKNGSTAYVGRIENGIIPPTNSWVSGMVLQSTPLPVYPMPLSLLAKDTGFEIGLPTITSTSTVIAGGHAPGVMATLSGATNFQLSHFDKVSATLNYRKDSQTLGSLTLAQGSPYVFYRATTDTTLAIDGIGSVVAGATNSYVRYSKAGRDYIVVTDKDATINLKGATASVAAPRGSLITFYALPSGSKDTLRDFAGNELTSVGVKRGVDNAASTTTFHYETTNNKPTVFVPISYSTVTNLGSPVTTYDSIYGPMNALSGSSFTVSTPSVEASNQLDLSGLTEAHKQQLIDSLKKDVASTSITAGGTARSGGYECAAEVDSPRRVLETSGCGLLLLRYYLKGRCS
jgi:endo-1,3(4)-beta-glucanase